MAVAAQRIGKDQDLGCDEFEIQVNDLGRRTFNAIEDARGKMTDEEREVADGKARKLTQP